MHNTFYQTHTHNLVLPFPTHLPHTSPPPPTPPPKTNTHLWPISLECLINMRQIHPQRPIINHIRIGKIGNHPLCRCRKHWYAVHHQAIPYSLSCGLISLGHEGCPCLAIQIHHLELLVDCSAKGAVVVHAKAGVFTLIVEVLTLVVAHLVHTCCGGGHVCVGGAYTQHIAVHIAYMYNTHIQWDIHNQIHINLHTYTMPYTQQIKHTQTHIQ